MQKYRFCLGILLVLFISYLSFSQDISYDIHLKLDTASHTLEVKADITISENAIKGGDTLWFYLPFNTYSNKYNGFTDDLRMYFPNSDYFFRKEMDMVSMSALIIKTEDKPTSYFFKDNFEKEFVGMIMSSAHINFSYKLRIPHLINGLGYLGQNYFLRHFYPQLVEPSGRRAFSHNSVHIPKQFQRASLKVNIQIPNTYEVFTNAFVQQNGSDSVIISAVNTDDLNINLIKPVKKTSTINPILKTKNKDILYNITHLSTPDLQIWQHADKALQAGFTYLSEELGDYPFDNLQVYIGTKDLQGYSENGVISIDDNKTITTSGNLVPYFISQLAPTWLKAKLNYELPEDYWLIDGLAQYYVYMFQISKSSVESLNFYPKVLQIQDCSKKYQMTPLTTDVSLLSSDQLKFNRYFHSQSFFRYAAKLVGDSIFNQVIQSFYKDKTRFSLNNLTLRIDQVSGKSFKKTLNFYAESSEYPSYSIKTANQHGEYIQVEINNRTKVSMPFPLQLTYIDGSTKEFIIDGFTGEDSTIILDASMDSVSTLTIDNDCVLPAYCRDNVHYYPSKRNHGGMTFSFILNKYQRDKGQISWALFPGYNNNDGIMAGAFFTNSLACKKVNYTLSPMYSFKNKKWVGEGSVHYDQQIQTQTFDKITYRLGVKSYDMFYNEKNNYALRFIKIDPTLQLHFNIPDMKGIQSYFILRSLIIFEESANFTQGGVFTEKSNNRTHIHQLIFKTKSTQATSNSSSIITLEQQSYSHQYYLKLTASATKEWFYQRQKSITARLFLGGFLINSQRKSGSYQNIFTRGSLALIHQGFNDYTYDEMFFSRQNQSQMQNDQFSLINGGGFKTALGSAYSIGMSNDLISSVNISAHIPLITTYVPLKIYFDIGTYSTFDGDQRKNNIMFNGGLMINLKDILIISLPMIFSEPLGNIYKGEHKNLFNRLSFGINLKNIKVGKQKDTVKF